MDGSSGLMAGLDALEATLNHKRLELLGELRQIEADIAAARTTRASADRLGFGGASHASPTPFPPAPQAHQQRPQQSAQPGDVMPFPKRAAHVPPTTEQLEAAIGAKLGPVRDDRAIPPRLDRHGRRLAAGELPPAGPKLDALRDGVRGVTEKAAQAKPGPGGRKRVSARGLVPGEPLAPALRRILEASDRPLTTSEVTMALVQLRGLDIQGPELRAVQNRVSTLLSQDYRKKKVGRLTTESRMVLWMAPGQAGDVRAVSPSG